ncbi:MAG: hypothetical protein ACRCZS_25875, partial [Chroococcidiopsis sp.]
MLTPFTMLTFELFMQNYNDEITEKFKCDRSIYQSQSELIKTLLKNYKSIALMRSLVYSSLMMKQTVALFTLVLAQSLSADVTGNASTHASTIHASAATVQLVPANIQQKSDRLGWDEQIWG